MTSSQQHWTEADVESFAYRVAFDFTTFVRNILASGQVSQSDFAGRLGVTEGRVSQILNSPGNLTLKQIVKIARALRRKVALIGYDDGDAENADGPINAGVFMECWERAGKPRDFLVSQAASMGSTEGTVVAIGHDAVAAATGAIATSENLMAATVATVVYDSPSDLFSVVVSHAHAPMANVSMASTRRHLVPVAEFSTRPN